MNGRWHSKFLAGLGTSLILLSLMVNSAMAAAGDTTNVSVASDGTQGNNDSRISSISADGRYVAFSDYANNLVSGDTNDTFDIFVHDRQTGQYYTASLNTYLLSVSIIGTGRGTVTSNPSGFNCGSSCYETYNQGTSVTLTATASTGSTFTGWGGACSGTGTCTVTMDADKSVTATFILQTFTLSVSKSGTGSGTVTSNPAGINCGSTCSYAFDYNTVVTLTASPTSISTLGGWSGGGCSGTGTCTVTMSSAQSVTALINLALHAPGDTTRVSVASDGTQGWGDSKETSISADGRYVAFTSLAINLVSGGRYGWTAIFVHDRQSGKTERVSITPDGTEGNNSSNFPSISADGRYVAFWSYASNLVSGDTNNRTDIFVHDRQTGWTTRVSVASDGTQGNGPSYATNPSISADGRYVAFSDPANNLVSGDTNDTSDVFVHDRQTGQTTRISVASDGTQGWGDSFRPSISADGRYVAFSSSANNLVSGDTNNYSDVFVHDRSTGETTLIPVASDSTQGPYVGSGEPSISADGRYVAFISNSTILVGWRTEDNFDVFVHDRQTGQTTLVSMVSDGVQGSNMSFGPSISADGRYVAFYSGASNLVSGDTNSASDVFVHDRSTGQTTRVSVASDGTQGNYGGSYQPSISADGRYVAFCSYATNLVSGDTNYSSDVFVHENDLSVFSPTISGNAGIVGATLNYTDGTPKTVISDGSANYSFTVTYNWSGNVTPTKTGYTFTPASITYTNVLSDQTGQNYIALPVGPTISGNTWESGVTLSYIDGTPKTVISDGNGNYSLTVTNNWSGTVTPSKTGYTFNPASITYANVLANQTGQNYVALPITFTISGNAWESGVTLSYIDGTPKTAISDGNGNYSLTVTYNWSGTVTPSKTGYTFNPASITYTNVLTDQTGQNYVALPITYTISGNAGVEGATLSYTDGTPKTVISDSSGNYSLSVTYNWSGTVTPSKAGYAFLPDNRTYTNVVENQTAQNYTAVVVTFTDVSNSYWAWSWIERLYAAGVTSGCSTNPMMYCPEDPVTRAQMAIFLERGMNGSAFTPPAGTGTVFADVPLNYWAVNWIEKLYVDGITVGCATNPLRYCPEDSVTRAQMSLFLLRARHGSTYTPPVVGSSTGFNDISTSHWAAAWIKQLAAEGITTGCGSGNYCPEDSVTRAQMAVFLVRTFNLP